MTLCKNGEGHNQAFNMKKFRVSILFGGRSGGTVSLLSAASVFRASDKAKFDGAHRRPARRRWLTAADAERLLQGKGVGESVPKPILPRPIYGLEIPKLLQALPSWPEARL
jgi:hypothetical protein